jgi:hypothetical protein
MSIMARSPIKQWPRPMAWQALRWTFYSKFSKVRPRSRVPALSPG